jgi:hypothetical protein
VNGRIVVSPAGFSAMTGMWVLLVWGVVWDRTKPDRVVCTSRPSKALGSATWAAPWV